MLGSNRKINTLEDLRRAVFEIEDEQLRRAKELTDKGNFNHDIIRYTQDALLGECDAILFKNYILPDEYVLKEFDEIDNPTNFYLNQGMSKENLDRFFSEIMRHEHKSKKSVLSVFRDKDHYEYKNLIDSLKMMGCDIQVSLMEQVTNTDVSHRQREYQTTNLFTFKETKREIVLWLYSNYKLGEKNDFIEIRIYEGDFSSLVMMDMMVCNYVDKIKVDKTDLLLGVRLQFNSHVFFYVKEFMETGSVNKSRSDSMFEQYQLQKFKQTLIDEGISVDIKNSFNRKNYK